MRNVLLLFFFVHFGIDMYCVKLLCCSPSLAQLLVHH